MGIKNSNGLKNLDLTGIQVLQNPNDGTVTNVLYNACVYSTSCMNSTQLHEFITDLKAGIQGQDPCQRIMGVVKAWLQSIGQLENVLNKKEEIKKELAKARVIKASENAVYKADYIENKLAKIDAGNTRACEHVDIDAISKDLAPSPRKIVMDYLRDCQYRCENVYNKTKKEYEMKLVKSDKLVFIPLNKLLAYYYSMHDMTSKESLKESNKIWNVNWNALFEIEGQMTSYVVLKMVIKAWLDFYKINKEVTDDELNKIVRYMQEVGV